MNELLQEEKNCRGTPTWTPARLDKHCKMAVFEELARTC